MAVAHDWVAVAQWIGGIASPAIALAWLLVRRLRPHLGSYGLEDGSVVIGYRLRVRRTKQKT